MTAEIVTTQDDSAESRMAALNHYFGKPAERILTVKQLETIKRVALSKMYSPEAADHMFALLLDHAEASLPIIQEAKAFTQFPIPETLANLRLAFVQAEPKPNSLTEFAIDGIRDHGVRTLQPEGAL